MNNEKNMDEELVQQIKSVFENFDDGKSEIGWATLREKYPETPSKKLPIWWITGIAASILVILGLFLLLDKSPKIIVGTKQIVKQKNEVKILIDTPKVNSPFVLKKENNVAKSVLKKTLEPSVSKQQNVSIKTGSEDLFKEKSKVTQPEGAVAINSAVQKKPSISLNVIANSTDTTKNTTTHPVEVVKNLNESSTTPKGTKKSTEEFLKEQSKILTAKETTKEKKTGRNQNSIDIFTGTFLNYYADNEVKVNAGFGLNASIEVAKSVFLSFGAGVSQNKISYQNTVPATTSNAAAAFSAGYATNSAYTTISDVKINAQLLSIDLPITLKFYPSKKQNFYVATGINSNSYLSQKYVYGYSLTNPSLYKGVTQKQEQTEKSKFKGFDFANSAIFAIGINQNIGKNNALIFEPYFKPAIGGMGEKNLKINTVGINLKFSFSKK